MKWTKKHAIDFLWKFGELKTELVDDQKLSGLRQVDNITEFRFAAEGAAPVTYWAVDISQDPGLTPAADSTDSSTLLTAAKPVLAQVQKIAPNARLQFVKVGEDRGKTFALVRTFPQKRLDTLVAERFNLSRAAAKTKIEAGKVSLNHPKTARAVKGSASAVLKPAKEYDEDVQLELAPTPQPESTLDLPVLYQDEDVIVIDKPSGILSHSKGEFSPEETVATWLADREEEQSEDPSHSERRGIVHRLDRGTSGVMILARNPVAEKFLQKQFAERKANKTYLAITEGEPKQHELILDLPIARNFKKPTTFLVSGSGKPAQTHLRVAQVAPMGLYSLLELKPATGRTHQLRVHLAYLNHPILGDEVYGGKKAPRLMLHASELELTLPNSERKTFKSKTPPEFSKYVSR